MEDSCSKSGDIICLVCGSELEDLACSTCLSREIEDPISAPKQIS